MPRGLTFLPHLGGAAALDDEHNFFVEMFVGIESACAGHLNDIRAPQAFGP